MVDSADRQKVFSVIDSRFEDFVRELSEYTRIPTISAQGTRFQEGADATRKVLEARGARVRLMPEEGGPPVVIGEIVEEPSLPWVILYNHYDVQPVDPLDEWETDPFEPVVKDGKLFGRGTSDTKGNVVAQATAIQAIRDVAGRLPVNVRYFVDGEEESGSPHLPKFADAHPELFKGLGATIEAAGHTTDGRPVMSLGSKGILSVELGVRTAKGDQHSSLAAILPNAAWRLIAALRTLRSENGKILIEGFHDGVIPPDPEMLRYLRKNSADPLRYKEVYGVSEVFGGRTRYQRLKRFMYGTTCTIDGIWSGYTGDGHKTVNPAVAHAKLDFRLLPGQRPDAIFDKLVAHLRNKGFADVSVDKHSTFEPASSSIRERLPQAILAAVREVYRTEPLVYPWSAGSSTTWYFTRVGTPSPHPPGVGYDGSRAHAPNENIRLADARQSMKAIAATIMTL
ncbi:MAG: M20/M25/M40 family metallo-hydrolase [Methanobacteriota archaeon]|nr:MAG: M20/M25/M40 family metallo-hydrolase [Euryarchaeota archaeon]